MALETILGVAGVTGLASVLLKKSKSGRGKGDRADSGCADSGGGFFDSGSDCSSGDTGDDCGGD